MLDKRDMTPMKWYLLVLGVLLGVSTVLTGCDLLQGLPKELPPSSSIRCDVSQCYGNLGGSLLFRVDSQGQFHRLHRLTSSEGRDTVSLLTDTTGDLYGVNEGGPITSKRSPEVVSYGVGCCLPIGPRTVPTIGCTFLRVRMGILRSLS